MHPNNVSRLRLNKLTDLPNIGKAGAADLQLLGITLPSDLIGQCPYAMHKALCDKTGVRHDPCVIDVFISITRFMAGEDARVWWDYTAERKQTLAAKVNRATRAQQV